MNLKAQVESKEKTATPRKRQQTMMALAPILKQDTTATEHV